VKKNINSKTKILLYFTSALTLGFFIINTVSFFYIKNHIDKNLEKDVEIYKKIYMYKDKKDLIPYLHIETDIKDKDNPNIVGKVDGKFIVVDKKKLYEKLIHYIITLFLWEVFVMFLVLILANKLVQSTIEKEKEIKGVLEVFILAFTHKLKNFLGIQRVNIEILKINFNKKALKRLEKAYILMEKDFEILIQALKSLREFREKREEVNLKNIFEEIIKELESIYPEKSILIKLDSFKVKADKKDIKNILFVILENAFKYSEKRIFITDFQDKHYYTIKVYNDISFQEKGTGVGLEIAKFLARKYNWEIKKEAYENEYILYLKIPKK